MDKATPASSVFPMWPQNTVLTKLMRNTIIWDTIYKENRERCSLLLVISFSLVIISLVNNDF